MSQRAEEHIDALTSLRFFAAFYVLIFHSGGPALTATGLLPKPAENFLANGYLGVSFFFVLSGFILTYVYFGRLGPQSTLKRYAIARFSRVYPVYLLSLLLMIPFVPATEFWHIWPQFVLLQSWIPLAIADGSYTANWNMQAWTLSVELLFYLSFPFLLVGAQSLSRASCLVVIAICCALIFVFRLPEIRGTENLLYGFLIHIPLPFLRMPEFVYGILLGVLFCRGHAPVSRWGLWAAMLATVVALSASSSLWVAPFVAILVGIIILLVPTSLNDGPLKRLLSHPVMVLLGGASFAIYILQLPVHLIVGAFFPGPYAFIGKLAYVPILIAVSLIVFLWYEEPARERIKRLAARRPVPAE